MDVELTEEGRRLVDEAVTRHVANEQDMLSVSTHRDRIELARITSKLITHLSG
jgi:DNA-binding MarR family transcriptional regulator